MAQKPFRRYTVGWAREPFASAPCPLQPSRTGDTTTVRKDFRTLRRWAVLPRRMALAGLAVPCGRSPVVGNAARCRMHALVWVWSSSCHNLPAAPAVHEMATPPHGLNYPKSQESARFSPAPPRSTVLVLEHSWLWHARTLLGTQQRCDAQAL